MVAEPRPAPTAPDAACGVTWSGSPPASGPSPEALAGGTGAWVGTAKPSSRDACNLRCFMCNYWKGKREGELSTDEVTRVLDELVALGCRKVHFTGGEIPMRRDLEVLAAHHGRAAGEPHHQRHPRRQGPPQGPAAGAGAQLTSPSTARPAPSTTPSAAARAPSPRPRTLDRALDKRGRKTRVRVNTVVSRRNVRTLVGLGALLRDRPVDGRLLLPLDVPDDHPDSLRAADIQAYTTRVAPVLEETLRIPGFDPWIFGRRAEDHAQASAGRFARGLYEAQPCYAPWLHLLIGPTGDVYPCCNLHRRMTPLGNIRDAPLSEIWQDEPLRAFRQQMWAKRVADCHRCADFSAENRALHAHLGPR